MKSKLSLLLIFLITINKIHSLDEYPTDDEFTQKVRDYIYTYANDELNNVDIKAKMIKNGLLPEGYPKQMIKNARKIHDDKSNWRKVMSYPTEIWGFCIYPKYKVNSINWCTQIYSLTDSTKLNDCKHSFCNVCCDHVPVLLREIANQNPVGQKVMLNKPSGVNRISKVINQAEINKCRNECNRAYPIKMPVILPAPPRDPKLGKDSDNAARSCSDIKKWGAQDAKTGEYWIDLGKKGKTIANCDMETDNGGWTLFFNYVHKPSQEIFIDSSKLPQNLNQNSHINLNDMEIYENDINELKFMCVEKSKKKFFSHFIVSNRDFINLAIRGDQSSINQITFKNLSDNETQYKDLYLKNTTNWTRTIDKDHLKDFNYINNNKIGNFWNAPFGSLDKRKFWSVKNGRFECGTYHKDELTNSDANLVYTHHNIWFRGEPLSVEEARLRYNARNFK